MAVPKIAEFDNPQERSARARTSKTIPSTTTAPSTGWRNAGWFLVGMIGWFCTTLLLGVIGYFSFLLFLLLTILLCGLIVWWYWSRHRWLAYGVIVAFVLFSSSGLLNAYRMQIFGGG